MLGVMNDNILRVIDSFGRTFNMPYVTTSEPAPGTKSNFTVYLRPPYHRPLVALARHYGWTRFYYVYDTEQGKRA